MWFAHFWTFTSNMTCLFTTQTKIVCTLTFLFYCVKGLNFILSIYMGSSFGKVAEGWANIAGEKFFCVTSFIYL
jgi:hypothetical protein